MQHVPLHPRAKKSAREIEALPPPAPNKNQATKFSRIDGKYLWSLNCWARGAMMVYCNLMVTTMVDSNEMFVNEAIHQGTDMRHPMCPNAIFSIEKKPSKRVRRAPKNCGA